MITSIILGRAASCLESFAAGLCLTIVASAFLYAADAQIDAAVDASPAPVTAEA